MGINRSQFLQIAMIAQGDFLKLLLAPTEERKKIFRQIFKTQLYQDLQDRLKKESGQLNDECDAARNSIKQYIDGIACDENDVLSIEVEKAKNGLLPAKDVMDLIDRLLTQDNDKKTAIQKSISDADKALEIVNANLGKIEAKEQTQKALDQARKNLIGENETNLALKAAFDIEKGKVSEREQLAEEKAKLEAEFPRYEALAALEKQIKNDEDTISKNERQLKKDREQYAIDEAEFKILKKEFESLSDAGEGKEKLSRQKEKTQEKLSKGCKTFQHYLRPFTNLVTIWILSKAITKKPRSHPRKQLPIMKRKTAHFWMSRLESSLKLWKAASLALFADLWNTLA